MRLLAVIWAFLSFLLAGIASADAGPNLEALLNPRPAKRLSEYQLFANPAAQAPNKGLHPYDLQQPLFTDYAQKYRFIFIPPGSKAAYSQDEVFDFPVGSVLVKTFAYPADFRQPNKAIRLVETRLLIHQRAGWTAFAYVWNEAQTDAVLKLAGKRLPLSWTDKKGVRRNINYVVPNKNQCKGCHTLNRKFSPIGPKARNLNKDFTYPSGAENQLSYWTKQGLLTGAPAPRKAPSIPAFGDASAPTALRARAYLDINCAHCHRREGPASTSGLFLTYGETQKAAWGYKKRPVAAGRGSGGLTYDIDPKHPDRSILIFRLQSNDPGIMMPEIGRTLVHTEGVQLLRNWIKSLEID